MQQLDLNLSQVLKTSGMQKAVANSGEKWLPLLKGIARALAHKYRVVDADMVHQYVLENELDIPKGPFWGSIFKGKEWEFTGERRVSAQPKNHGREIKIWRLRNENNTFK